MKLKQRYAVISWCPDLTDPNAVSVPVAVLLIAQKGTMNFAAAMGVQVEGDLDAFERDLLRDVPQLIRRYVDDYVKSKPSVSADDVLFAVHNALRNSLHVSKITDEKSTTMDSFDTQALMTLLQSLFESEVKGPIAEICGVRKDEHQVEPLHLMPIADAMPAWQAWKLEQMRNADRLSYPS